jgi:hypothetical protein
LQTKQKKVKNAVAEKKIRHCPSVMGCACLPAIGCNDDDDVTELLFHFHSSFFKKTKEKETNSRQ